MLQGASEAVRETILRRLPLRDRKTGVALRLAPIWSPFNTAWAKSCPLIKNGSVEPYSRVERLGASCVDLESAVEPAPPSNLSSASTVIGVVCDVSCLKRNVPTFPFGRMGSDSAVGKHDLSRDRRLFWRLHRPLRSTGCASPPRSGGNHFA
jgi:hypothetical protein